MQKYSYQGHAKAIFAPELSLTTQGFGSFYDPRFKNPIFSTATLSGLGNLFEDVIDPGGIFHEGGIIGVQQFTQAVVAGLKEVGAEIGLALSKIDWQKIARVFFIEINPFHWIYSGLSTNPYTEHMFRELDKFTGGTCTSFEDVNIVVGRSLSGETITTREIVSDVIFVVKVVLVLVTGGAAAWIGFAADQLKGGYLGESETGRVILTIASAAAITYAAGGTVTEGVKNAGVAVAQEQGEKQLVEKTPLGQSEAGRFIAGAGVRAGGAGALGNSTTGAVASYATDTGKTIAKREVAQEIGGPYANAIANVIVERGYPPTADSSSGSSGTSFSQVASNVWEEIKRSPDNIVNAIKNFNISVSSGQSTGSKIDINPKDAGSPRSGSGNPIVQMPELNIKGLEFPPKDLNGWENLMCKIKFASTLTSSSLGMGALPINASLNSKGQIEVADPLAKGAAQVCAKARKRVRVGNEWLWIYILADGTYYWTFDEITIDNTNKYILWAMIAAGVLMVVNES